MKSVRKAQENPQINLRAKYLPREMAAFCLSHGVNFASNAHIAADKN